MKGEKGDSIKYKLQIGYIRRQIAILVSPFARPKKGVFGEKFLRALSFRTPRRTPEQRVTAISSRQLAVFRCRIALGLFAVKSLLYYCVLGGQNWPFSGYIGAIIVRTSISVLKWSIVLGKVDPFELNP